MTFLTHWSLNLTIESVKIFYSFTTYASKSQLKAGLLIFIFIPSALMG